MKYTHKAHKKANLVGYVYSTQVAGVPAQACFKHIKPAR